MASEAPKVEKDKDHNKILAELQALRNDQRNIVSTISSFEQELKEHKWVNGKMWCSSSLFVCITFSLSLFWHRLIEIWFEFLSKSSRTVIDTLKNVDENRKCFRLIGGVLCERTVKDVLPQLHDSVEQLEKVISSKQEQLSAKGVELNKFREANNIKIKGQDEDVLNTDDATDEEKKDKRNVLIA